MASSRDVNDVGGFAGGVEEPVELGDKEIAIGALQAALRAVEGDDLPLEKVAQRVGELISKRRPPRKKKLVRIGEVLPEAFDLMDARATGKEKPIETPWADFNEQLPGGGYWPGAHVLVAGTGFGKTTATKQIALHAAVVQKVPCGIAGLEIDPIQGALRLAGELAKESWSKAWAGELKDARPRQKMRDTEAQLQDLPIYLESGAANGWPVSELRKFAERLREAHPDGPLLIVVDFLQLIGPEPGVGRQELRERIGRAAYEARMIAVDLKATVLLISSVARESYSKVSGWEILKEAGVDIDEAEGEKTVLDRFIRSPDQLVGLGKESGEIEFAADTVTVGISLPRPKKPKGKNAIELKRQVVIAVAKLRFGSTGWCSLLFNGFRFENDPSHGRAIAEEIKKPKTNGDKDGDKGSSSNGRKSNAPPKKESELHIPSKDEL